jgi:Cdc6-like AAA superfamily ATPase
MDERMIGRDKEQAVLAAFLDAIPAGASGLCLQGQAGIGKTVLWRHAIQEAAERSYRILACRPAEAETRLSYSALEDLLDPVLDEALAALNEPRRRSLEVALLRSQKTRRATSEDMPR